MVSAGFSRIKYHAPTVLEAYWKEILQTYLWGIWERLRVISTQNCVVKNKKRFCGSNGNQRLGHTLKENYSAWRVAIHMWLGLSHPLANDIHPSEPFDPPLLVKSPRTVGVRFPILASSPNMEKYWHMFATDMWCFPEIGGYPQFPSILFRCSRISQPFLGSPHLWKPYDTSMCISV